MGHIVAMGGGGFSMEPDNPVLDDYVLSLANCQRPRVCFLPTASGDSEEYIDQFRNAFVERAETSELCVFRRDGRDLRALVLEQDVLYVGGGGGTFNLLALWRAHGLDEVLKEALDRGAVLAGISAGAMCWFEAGLTDSFGPLAPLHDGLGLLSGAFCPHYDGESGRQAALHEAIRDGLPAAVAADDGAAAHYTNGQLVACVTSRPDAQVRRVEQSGGQVVETVLPSRFLG